MASFVRSVLSPQAYAETLTPAQWSSATRFRIGIVLVSLAVDFTLAIALREVSWINHAALSTFLLINIPVLAADLLVAIAMFKYERFRRTWLLQICVVAEALTMIVWVQATGSLTSYFMIVGTLLVIWYRISMGFTAARTLFASLCVFHLAAIGLEFAGILSSRPLFTAAPGPEYQHLAFKLVLLNSIASIYAIVFAASNFMVNKIRERDRTLAEVRAEAARAAEVVLHGRFTGKLIADDFALGELLGRGGMGEVYAARRVSDDGQFAIKVLHAHLAADVTAIERFRREAAATSRIPRQYVARVEHIGRDDAMGVDYIAMEYLRGEDLAAYLRRRGLLQPAEVVTIARSIGTALDAAHAVGVLHRDLKPQNVFILAPGTDVTRREIRLLDFGMSKLLDSSNSTLTKADALIGTVAYMAPEQALGAMDAVGPASDRYAFASITYRMLTGRLPFDEADLVRAINAIAHATPPIASSVRTDLPADVDSVLAIGLAKIPGDRYASASALVDDLEAALCSSLSGETRTRAAALSGAHPGVSATSRTLTAGD